MPAVEPAPIVARVVIAGAGPVGLMLAYELGRAGIAAVVLERDRDPDPMPKGNGLVGEIATVLQRRGLLRGEKGLHVIPLPRFPFGPLLVKVNPLRVGALKVLPIPQRRLEALLERHARAGGADIRRGHVLAGFRDDGGHVAVQVAAPSGTHTIRTEFLVGCDGAHSLVRHQLGVEFPGTTSSQLARIGRVTIPAGSLRRKKGAVELPGGQRLALFRANLTPQGSFSIASASGLDPDAPRDEYIVSSSEPRAGQEPAGEISLDEMRASIHRVLGVELPITGGAWLRSTVGNSRQAECYRVGRVFLAGDAAHVFSAGGSALNTGMLDAVDLAARLAAVLGGTAPLASLQEYHDVRHAAGRQTLQQTRAQSALSAPGENAQALREVLAAALDARNPRRYLATLLIGKGPKRQNPGG